MVVYIMAIHKTTNHSEPIIGVLLTLPMLIRYLYVGCGLRISYWIIISHEDIFLGAFSWSYSILH